MEIFAYILALIWSILCLILFFKILGMTNNVEQLAQEVHELKMVLVQEQTGKGRRVKGTRGNITCSKSF